MSTQTDILQIKLETTGDGKVKASLAGLSAGFESTNKKINEQNKLFKDGEAITKSLRTAEEKYADEKKKIKQLLAQGAITNQTYQRGIVRLREDLNKTHKSTNDLSKSSEKLADKTGGLRGKITASRVAIVALGTSAVLVATKIIQTTAQFEKLNASLKTVTGSQVEATRAMDMIKTLAADTPFSVQELTESFIKLKALGLEPSEEALVSYGNTASAMGKNLNDMIEAVADASTGEFERLKEFGIKARQQGDEVSLTFQGVTTTIGNNSQEIQKYLLDIGNTQFAGAMEEQMDTLNGAFSNLGDSVDLLMVAIGESGFGNAVKNTTQYLSNMVGVVTQNIEELGFLEGTLVGVAQAMAGMEVEKPLSESERAASNLNIGLRVTKEQADKLAATIAHLEGIEGIPPSAITPYRDALEKARQSLESLQLAQDQLTGKKTFTDPEKVRAAEAAKEEQRNKEAAKAREEAEKRHQALMKEGQAVYAQTRTEVEKLAIEQAKLDLLLNENAIDPETYQRRMDMLQEQLSEARKKVEEDADKMGDALNNAVTGWAAGFSSTLTDLVWDAEASFDSILESFGKMLTQMVIQQAVVNPMLQKMGFTTANAHGNVFSGGQVQAFASGGVVGGATYFPMAGGNTGLMGEAGPEAIMPLARLPNGDLGIKAQGGGGGGTVVQVIDQRSAAQPKAEVSSSRGADGTEFVRVIIREVKQGLSGGLFDREMSSNFGMSRRGS